MFKREQIEKKIDTVEKRSHNASLITVPTSILTAQTSAARAKFSRVKKFKFSWRSREVYQLR